MKRLKHDIAFPTPISHIVVVVMENRTVDNLFNGFPGADTVSSWTDPGGTVHQLAPISLETTYDIGHHHIPNFSNEFDFGANDGWNTYTAALAKVSPIPSVYNSLAMNWVLADEMLQTSEGPAWRRINS
jgi:phospholipase C